jgi:hypothetical protein
MRQWKEMVNVAPTHNNVATARGTIPLKTQSSFLFYHGVEMIRLIWALKLTLSLFVLGASRVSATQDRSGESDSIHEQIRVPKRNERVTGLSFRESSSVVPWPVLVGVSDSDAPNDELARWFNGSDLGDQPNEAIGKKIDADFIRSISGPLTIDCSANSLNDVKIVLAHAENIKWLRLMNCELDGDISWIGDMTWLRGLGLRGADLGEVDLSCLKELENLEWLDVGVGSVTIPEGKALQLPSLPNLEVLLLETEAIAFDFPGASHFPSLKVLFAAVSRLDDEDIRKLSTGSPGLHYLHLHSNSGVTQKSIEPLVEMENLRFIHIGVTQLETYLHVEKREAWLQDQMPKCYIGFGS